MRELLRMKTQNDTLPLENKGNIKLAGRESCYQWIGTADIQVLHRYSEVVKTAKTSPPPHTFLTYKCRQGQAL